MIKDRGFQQELLSVSLRFRITISYPFSSNIEYVFNKISGFGSFIITLCLSFVEAHNLAIGKAIVCDLPVPVEPMHSV